MRKILFFIPLLIITIISIIFFHPIFHTKTINSVDMGISISVPKNMLITYNNQRTFDYNKAKVPSISLDAASTNGKKMISIKTFPFPASDYMKHYKSAFTGNNIINIDYDYKEVKVSKKSPIKSLYESKATIQTDKGKKTVYSYVVSFKNRNGSLIIQFTGLGKFESRSLIKSINLTKPTSLNVVSKDNKDVFTNLKEFDIYKNVSLKVPSNFENKSRVSILTSSVYTNLYGKKNNALYVCVSTNKPLPISQSRWSMANGIEVVKVLESKDINGTFIIHNINNNQLYYLNSIVKETKSKSGETLYVRLDYTDKNNDKAFLNQVINSITVK